ncbi:MAG: hypothetical protein C4297_11120 [Gemmataceae bacterium]
MHAPENHTPPSREKAARERVRHWLYDLFLFHSAEQDRIQRAVTALGYGLDPAEYARPFPGSPTYISLHPAGRRLPAGWLVLLAGCLAFALGWYFGRATPLDLMVHWRLDTQGRPVIEVLPDTAPPSIPP